MSLPALAYKVLTAPQMELLLAYLHISKTEGEVKQADLLKKSGASAAQLKGLADKGVLVVEKLAVDRIRPLPMAMTIDFELSPAQDKALTELRASLAQKPVCLLHGVTSSGKTQLYIKLIEEQVRQGRQVLYLLPEIALTAQVIRRLQDDAAQADGIVLLVPEKCANDAGRGAVETRRRDALGQGGWQDRSRVRRRGSHASRAAPRRRATTARRRRDSATARARCRSRTPQRR